MCHSCECYLYKLPDSIHALIRPMTPTNDGRSLGFVCISCFINLITGGRSNEGGNLPYPNAIIQCFQALTEEVGSICTSSNRTIPVTNIIAMVDFT